MEGGRGRGPRGAGARPLYGVPMILPRWNEGRIKLAAPITKKYAPDEINEGYSDLVGGKNLRGSEQDSGS